MEHIVAVGAGRMGRGIAHVMAYAGFPVTLVDLKPRSPAAHLALEQEARAEITANLGTLQDAGIMGAADRTAILERIRFAFGEEAETAMGSADVLFEGVPEVMEYKQACLERVSALARTDAIIASTTSTFSAETLAEFVDGPERFLNAHWLNPAYLIPVVEVSPTRHTGEGAIEQLLSLLRRAGKMPVRCRPTPGFIIPRIQMLAMNEAARIADEGVASPADIDTASRFGFGLRFALLGLIEFIDYGGGDILYYASRYMTDAMRDDRFAAPEVINRMMERGETGLRAGKGFYDYRDQDVEAYQRETIAKFVDLLAHLRLMPRPHAAAAQGVQSNAAPPPPSKTS